MMPMPSTTLLVMLALSVAWWVQLLSSCLQLSNSASSPFVGVLALSGCKVNRQ